MTETLDDMVESTPTAQKGRVEDFELWMSNLLRFGVILSLVLVAIGTVLSFILHPVYIHDSTTLKPLITPGGAIPKSLGDLVTQLRQRRGQGITTLGLMVLIATPILRVAVSSLAFLFERDRKFVAITLTVLGLLLASLFLGRAGG